MLQVNKLIDKHITGCGYRARIDEALGDRAAMVDVEHEVEMARSDLYKIADYAIKLHDMLKSVSEEDGIDAELQVQIAKAAENMDEVFHAMDYGMKPDDFDIEDELSLDGMEDPELDGMEDPELDGMEDPALDGMEDPSMGDTAPELTKPSRSLESRRYKGKKINESANRTLKEVRSYDTKLTQILESCTLVG